MHKEIKESGLAEMYEIRPMTTDNELAKFLGKTVKYKEELLTADFVRANGSLCREEVFEIREVQKNHAGKSVLRGYFKGDTFGRCIDPEHIEVV